MGGGHRPKPKPKAKARLLGPRGRAAALSRPAWGSPQSGGPAGGPAKKRKDATLFVLDDVEFNASYFVADDGFDLGSCSVVDNNAGDSAAGSLPPASEAGPEENDEPLNRPKCEKGMVARQNKRSGGWFFGCSKYPDCKGTLGYGTGMERLRSARPPPSPL